MDKNEFYDSRDEYLEHAGVRDAVNKVRGKVWNKKVREARSGDKNEKLGSNKYLDRNFARPYSSANTTGTYDNPNAQAWVNKEGYYTENNTRAYSESVQNLVDQISAQLSKSENDKKRNSNAYFKAMKSVISREIGELADSILKIESSGSRKAYNKDLEDLRRRFNVLSFGNDYIAHAAYIPKSKGSRPYSSPNNVNVGGRYTAEDQRRNAENMKIKKIKEYKDTLKQARTILDEARKLLELDGAQAAFDHLNNYINTEFEARFDDLSNNRSIDKDIEKSFNELLEINKKLESDIRAALRGKKK